MSRLFFTGWLAAMASAGCGHAAGSASGGVDLPLQEMISQVSTLRDEAYCAALHVEVLSDVVVDKESLADARIRARKALVPGPSGPNLSQASAAMSANLAAVASARAAFRSSGSVPPPDLRTPRFSLVEYRQAAMAGGGAGRMPDGVSEARVRFVRGWTDYHDPVLGDAPRRLVLRWLHDQAREDPDLMEDYYRSFHAYLAEACQPAR